MKQFVTNRDNNSICVVVEHGSDPNKLVFIMHGLSGNKEEPHLLAITEAFIEDGYTVATWDAVHTFGESTGGKFEDATLTNYYNDLEDVIAWAQGQDWYAEPFVLSGHSFGGIATVLYAEKFPEKVRALAPISTMVSGELSMQAKAAIVGEWKRTGLLTQKRNDGSYKTLKWSHMEDRMKYDATLRADRLNMPVLMAVGSNDKSTPLAHQKILYDALPADKELHIIEGAQHFLDKPHEHQELKTIFKNWLQNKVK